MPVDHDHNHDVLEVCSAISPVLYSDCYIAPYSISLVDGGDGDRGQWMRTRELRYHGAWTARDRPTHRTSWSRRELWSHEHGARDKLWSSKEDRKRTIPVKLSTRDQIGKMYTGHYAPFQTVYGRVGQFGQSV